MAFDFYVFLSKENLIFFGIIVAVVLVVIVVCFLIIRFVVKLIAQLFKKIFHKEKPLNDQGEDVDIVVKELEQSKEERAKIKIPTATPGGPKVNYTNRAQAQEKEQDRLDVKSDKQRYDVSEQKDILEGLERIKGVAPEKTSFLGGNEKPEDSGPAAAKIKIPTAATAGPKDTPDSKIKIPEAKDFGVGEKSILPGVGKESAGPVIQSVRKDNKIKNQKDKPPEVKIAGNEGSYLFGSKNEISRDELRQKLSSAGAYEAETQVGLNLSPVERSKLEKKIFSQALGGNISKSDLRSAIKKLNQQYSAEKSPTAKSKIREEMKFFKKIGGIKG